jgi:nucleoside-diphosphate-sugar epimerase
MEKENIVSIVVTTGSAGLVGSEAARFFAGRGFDVVGIDNDMRRLFFGREASTEWNRGGSKANSGSDIVTMTLTSATKTR